MPTARSCSSEKRSSIGLGPTVYRRRRCGRWAPVVPTMLIVGNWKMNGAASDLAALDLVASTARTTPTTNVVVCPPYTMIAAASAVSGLRVGAQDCHEADAGAFTGCVSASMIRAAGAEYVLLGHSERRQQSGETSETVGAKAAAALRAGLVPTICVGETAAERASGRALDVVAEQLRPVTRLPPGEILVAYEPVWAIGTGRVPEMREVEAMMGRIGHSLRNSGGPNGEVKLLYGGSVNSANAAAILSIGSVSGLLVGGASLNTDEFRRIIELTRHRGPQELDPESQGRRLGW